MAVYPDLTVKALFEPGHTMAWGYLSFFAYPWEAIPGIKSFILRLGETLSPAEYNKRGDGVWVHKTAVISPSAFIGAAVIIGPETEVRHCAFIRGAALIGGGAVIGNSTEVKNSILFDMVQAPHYNYIGDSILGYGAHFGAGTIASNVKSDKTPVTVSYNGFKIETGLRKLGAVLGDRAEIGCNSVLNPGSVIGHDSTVYPLSAVRGCVPPGSIYKRQGESIKKV